MAEHDEAMEGIAHQVRLALEAADLSAFTDLLDPDVHWGPPDARQPTCKNRDQVLAWHGRGAASGVRAQVSETVVFEDRILVGLMVRRDLEAKDQGATVPRWQVLTVRDGRVVDIVGFDARTDALARAQMPGT
jgi:ketosteroid isomerase-like protein